MEDKGQKKGTTTHILGSLTLELLHKQLLHHQHPITKATCPDIYTVEKKKKIRKQHEALKCSSKFI